MLHTKRSFILLLVCLSVISTYAIGGRGIYNYKSPNGTLIQLINTGTPISGRAQSIHLIQMNLSLVSFKDGIQHQKPVWLYEYTKGNWMFFRGYDQIGTTNFSFKPMNIWIKISTDWNLFIDEKGKKNTFEKFSPY